MLSGLAMAATAGFAGGWAARGVSDQPSADAAVPAAAVASAAPALGTKGCPTPRAITSIKSNERVVALTFDDGPSAEVTGQILRTLADKKVKATFFMTGEHASAHPDLVAQIAAAGHAIGSHSWNHPRLDKLSPAQVTDQVERATNAVSVAAGTRVCLTRPPFGLTTPQVDALSAAMGLTTVGWTQNPRDWLNPTPEQLRRDSAPWSDRPATILLLRLDVDRPTFDFPGEGLHGWHDYAYVATQVLTTFATSDVEVRTTPGRRAISVLSIASMVFNTVVIALLVSGFIALTG